MPPTQIRATQIRATHLGTPCAARADSAYFLGLMHFYGEGVTEDHSRAFMYFKLAAMKGHVAAATNMGVLLEAGDGTSADSAAAFAWYRRGAAEGDAEAAYRAALMLYESRVTFDEHERMATAWQVRPANTRLGHAWWHSPVVCAIVRHVWLPMRAAHIAHAFQSATTRDRPHLLLPPPTSRCTRVPQLFVDAAAGGTNRAHYYVGIMLEYGVHLPQDFERAARHYDAGCTGGDGDACYHFGLMLAYGRGREQDVAAAARAFQEGYTQHRHAPCAYYLGILNANGQGVPTDYEAARAYFQFAARSGDVRVAADAGKQFATLDAQLNAADAARNATLTTLAAALGRGGAAADAGGAPAVAAAAVSASGAVGADGDAGAVQSDNAVAAPPAGGGT
jgi:TPR repeat protein